MTAKIISFPGLSSDTGAETSLDEHQAAIYEAILRLGNMLVENKDKVQFFTAVIAIRDPDNTDDPMAYNLVSSPMSLPEYALSVAMLQRSLSALLD